MSSIREPRAAVAAVVLVLLVAMSGRYGYHRDELYFLQAGRHLAWGYADQPPLTPLLARAMSAIAPDSLLILRLPSALSAAAIVWLAGSMARVFGAGRAGEWTAAGATGLCGFVLATGHLLSTATTAILGTAIVSWLLVGILRDAVDAVDAGVPLRRWLMLGAVAGVTLQANVFPAFFLVSLAVALAVAGPRALLRTSGPWIAALVAAVIISPYLIWQAANGWPQIDVAQGIASGDSASSVTRSFFLPQLALQVGPWLLLVWLPGLVRLLRDPRFRSLGVAFVLTTALVVVTRGKPYYVAGLFPLLIAAGAHPVLDAVGRRWIVAGAVLSTPALAFTLPVLPVDHAAVAVAVNPDAGETIGWPEFAAQVAAAAEQLPAGAPIVTWNYGQAGALRQFDRGLDLGAVYSGHNGFAHWGMPPAQSTVLAVGVPRQLLDEVCRDVVELGQIHTAHDIDNDEDGTSLRSCAPVRPWVELWPRFERLG